jgi:hypothetical protein
VKLGLLARGPEAPPSTDGDRDGRTTERMNRGRVRLAGLARWAALAALLGCAAASPPAGDNRYCAQLFDQLDAYDFMPLPVGPAFDFRQMQLARIRQARCLTFTRNLVGLDTVGGIVAPREAPSGPALIRPVAVQVGVVTNDNDAERAMAFFNHLGYRTRSVGSPGLGTRVYVEARTLGNIETIIGLAQEVGFIGPYPSRYATF